MFEACREYGVEMLVPEVVVFELSAHYATEAQKAASQAVGCVQKLVTDGGSAGLHDVRYPSVEEVEKTLRENCAAVGLQILLSPRIDVIELTKRAIARKPPFKDESNTTKELHGLTIDRVNSYELGDLQKAPRGLGDDVLEEGEEGFIIQIGITYDLVVSQYQSDWTTAPLEMADRPRADRRSERVFETKRVKRDVSVIVAVSPSGSEPKATRLFRCTA